MKRIIVATCIALVGVGILMQYGEDPPIVETNGVVKALNGSPGKAGMQSITVTLADGSLVQANVIPGCIVLPGEPVRMQSLHRNWLWQRTYLVLGPEKIQ